MDVSANVSAESTTGSAVDSDPFDAASRMIEQLNSLILADVRNPILFAEIVYDIYTQF